MKSLILLVPVLAVVAAKTTCNCDFTSRAVICKGLSLTEFHKKDSGCENAFWKIDISENNLQVYPDDLQQFREVNLSLNSLEHLETSIDTEVVYLDVSKNEIVEIDLGKRFLNLQHLIVANNYLGLMDDFLVGQCNIIHLDVSGNKIKSLKTVTKCAHLTILEASGNKISQIAKEIVHLTKLQVLDLSRNNIKDVSGLPTTLEILDLSWNIIQRVTHSSFRGLGSLQALDLSINRISIIEKHSFATLRSLQSLKLRLNKLNVLSGDLFKGLTSLRDIDISHNSIESLTNDTFSDLSALEKVTLESNEIRTLPALQFGRKLIKISFSGNSITKMDYSALLTMFSGSRDERYISFLVDNFHGDDPEWSNVLKYFDGECSSALKYATQKVLHKVNFDLNNLNFDRYTKYILDPSSCACAIFKKGKWKFTACIADGGEVDGLPWLEAAEIYAGMKEDVGRPSKPWRNEF